ncbi:MAG: S1C family serine protease [Pyrinomonadaceae bacterium]
MPKRLLWNIKNFTPFSVKIVSIIFFLVSVTRVFAQNSDQPALTPKQVAQRTLPSIVILIMNNGDSLPVTTGSGFFVAEDTIITNYHVVKNARLGAFRIYGSDEVYSVIGTVGIDSVNDLALLKVKNVKGKPLKLNGSYQFSIGDEVFTASSPKGLEGSFSQGLISGLRKTSKKDLIQITAPISHGSSGGAILNNQAEVIAVAVGGIDEGQSLNFAVPIKYAQTLMAKRDSLADLPGRMNNSYGNTPRFTGEVSSGGRQNANPVSSIGSVLGLSVKSPTAIINESVIKAPSAVSEIIKSRIPPPVLRPNQFKVPDLIEDNLRGDVFTTLEITYEAVANFDKFTKGEKTLESLHSYDPAGNVIKEINPGIKTIDGTSLDWIHQRLTTYNPTSRSQTVKVYGFEDKILLKEVTTYNSQGEKIATYLTDYIDDEKGILSDKDTVEYSNQFSKNKSCSAENVCETTYTGLDENGIETIINYNSENFPKYIEKRIKKDDLTVKYVLYNFCHPKSDKWGDCTYNGKLAKITVDTYSHDSQTKEKISFTTQKRNLDNPNEPLSKESYKYEYKYDSKGNWVEKIEKKEVTKFGETYFEPVSFHERQIRYYSDEDAKPSVNKTLTVKRKKN